MTAAEAHSQAFPPSVGVDARLLLLGSLPGAESLRRGQYYAHPGNAFWHLVGGVVGEALPDLPYELRLDRLKAHRIGLWDVIGSAWRTGSLDAAIRDAQPRDLAAFAATLPDLRAIAFNGGTAARIGRRQLAGITRYALVDLPSSSAAHAAMPRAAKLEAWRALGPFLD